MDPFLNEGVNRISRCCRSSRRPLVDSVSPLGGSLSPREYWIRTEAGPKGFGIGQLQGRTDRQSREVRYLRVCVGQAAPGTTVAQVFA
jgi:hypothetical protein